MLRYCASLPELGHEGVATLSEAAAVLYHCGAAVRAAVAHAASCAQRADASPRPSLSSERAFAATLLACAITAEPIDHARPLSSSIDDAWVRGLPSLPATTFISTVSCTAAYRWKPP